MKRKLMSAYLKGKHAVKNFLVKEDGASDIVAIILIIVVLIAVAAIFKTQLTAIVTDVFDALRTALGV